MSGFDTDWHTLDGLLDTLLDLEGDAREQRMTAIAAERPDLARRLRRMLDSVDSGIALESLAATPLCSEALSRLSGLGPGDRLGDWTLLRSIGRGGMAEVFEAERTVADTRQRAAIKLMAQSGFDPLRQQRFKRETSILARLADPRLACLFDAGVTADGRHWLAMEYVDGEPIDRACDRRALSLRDRVRLMVDVALAVDYAHRQLVVHRDLKPDNILLSADGRIHVLDFGIARMLQGEGSAAAADATATQLRAYTLRFASPEQLGGSVAGVASDVFQLGLLLHVLCCGSRPFVRVDDDPIELLQAIRAGATLPSRQAATVAAEVAAARSTTPKRLAGALRGDLDSIILHALEADPERRYPGARDLADDLQRWLEVRPINARGYSRTYRAARYLRRHWIGASAVATIGVLLLGYAFTVTWQSQRIEAERVASEQARLRAEAMHGFLLQIFASADPNQSDARGKPVETLLREGVERARTEFSDQPLLAAQLLVDLSQVLMRRGELAIAETAIRDAVALRERHLGGNHTEVGDALTLLFDVLLQQRRLDEAHAIQMRRMQIVREHHSEGSLESLAVALGLAMIESRLDRDDYAESVLRNALDAHRRTFGNGPWTDAPVGLMHEDLRHQYGLILYKLQRFEDAERTFREITTAWEARFGHLDPRTMTARKNWAGSLGRLERVTEARQQLERVLEGERQLFPGPHLQRAYTLGHIASLANRAGDYDQAADLWQRAESEAIAAAGHDHPWPPSARLRAARAMISAGRTADAIPLLESVGALEGRSDDIAQQARDLLRERADE